MGIGCLSVHNTLFVLMSKYTCTYSTHYIYIHCSVRTISLVQYRQVHCTVQTTSSKNIEQNTQSLQRMHYSTHITQCLRLRKRCKNSFCSLVLGKKNMPKSGSSCFEQFTPQGFILIYAQIGRERGVSEDLVGWCIGCLT